MIGHQGASCSSLHSSLVHYNPVTGSDHRSLQLHEKYQFGSVLYLEYLLAEAISEGLGSENIHVKVFFSQLDWTTTTSQAS
jgi:hypothetical protein